MEDRGITQTQTMSEPARDARRAYQRQWAHKNKNRIREYERKYWEKKAGKKSEEGKPETGGGQNGES